MKNRGERLLGIYSVALFILYLIILVWVVIFKCNIYASVTGGYHYLKTLSLEERLLFYIKPFADYVKDGALVPMKLKDGVLNAVAFLPFGLYVSYFVKRRKLLATLAITLVSVTAFELFQLYSIIGSFQTEDFIIDIFGALLGYIVYRIIYKKKNSRVRLVILNTASIFALVLLIPLSVYAVTSTVENLDLYVSMIERSL